jgi:hypothetical protein
MSKKNKAINYQLTLWAIIVACVTILILLATCNGCKRGGQIVKPTSDSTKTIQPKEERGPTEPILVLENGRIPDDPKVRIDSFIYFDIVEKVKQVDTNAIVQEWIDKYNAIADKYNSLLADWNAKREYEDSARFKAGLVKVKNTAQRNRIFDQQIILDSAMLLTINNTIPEKKRNKIGLALGGQYWSDTTIALGIGFTLQTKNGRQYGLKGLVDTKQKWGVMGEVVFPLSLRRNK